MSILSRLFAPRADRAAMAPLYAAAVAEARRPGWYRDGGVPDTLDGRFDMVAAVLAVVLMRLDDLGQAGPAARLTERFIGDMDAQLRERGMGDVVVGKHVGRMVAALGGRLGAYRAGLAPGGDLDEALLRNLWRGERPPGGTATVARDLRALAARVGALAPAELLAGRLA